MNDVSERTCAEQITPCRGDRGADGRLDARALLIRKALAGLPASNSVPGAFMTADERGLLQAAARARLGRQVEFVRAGVVARLCREFAELTGYTLLGLRMEGPAQIGDHEHLVTVNLHRSSRSIDPGPCVLSGVPIEEYEKQLPSAVLHVLADVRHPFDLFEDLICAEPVVKRKQKDGSALYCRSLREVRRMMQPRTIDPLVIGSLAGAGDHVFCLAHWD
jgi:hypothetical protein